MISFKIVKANVESSSYAKIIEVKNLQFLNHCSEWNRILNDGRDNGYNRYNQYLCDPAAAREGSFFHRNFEFLKKNIV